MNESILEKITVNRRINSMFNYLLANDACSLDVAKYMERSGFYDEFDKICIFKKVDMFLASKIYTKMITDVAFMNHMNNLFEALGVF